MARDEEDDESRNTKREKEEIICRCLEKAICELHHQYFLAHKDRLRRIIRKSISLPNYKGNDGKPHDVETRIALTLFHQWKREAERQAQSTESKKPTSSSHQRNSIPVVAIISDLGLTREISSPRQLADLLCPLLEEEFRNNIHWKMAPDVRSQASGIVSMISAGRSQYLRKTGKLPCPHCIQWCKGEKGLWWHQQQFHAIEHSDAAATAQSASNSAGAMIVYNETNPYLNQESPTDSSMTKTITTERTANSMNECDPLDSIRSGNLYDLRDAVERRGYQPSTVFDKRGATPLMWAAGSGHLEITRYLIKDCKCDPTQSQKGKRSFAGRTALHWAARNGHLEVVQYLLSLAGPKTTCFTNIPLNTLLEAKTQDGTTAFGWACWQRHISVMECLYQHGCDIHGLNSYGCSPVLWCSQGTNEHGLEALRWLQDKGCCMTLVNHNGHGVLHKAAQRGQVDVAEWLVGEECGDLLEAAKSDTTKTETGKIASSTMPCRANMLLAMVGPDTEGYCPSDLAGMEGHEKFATWLATIEIQMCRALGRAPDYEIPKGFTSDAVHVSATSNASHVWEKYGGLRRIRSALKKVSNIL